MVRRWLCSQAYAKINLHLEIGDSRPDGYHNLISLFHLISLSDSIAVYAEASDQFSCSIKGQPDIDSEKNLMFVAAQAFCESIGKPLAVTIDIIKRIPMKAGLGGGSSDAACILRLLNELEQQPLDAMALNDLAIAIGSDVPFFVADVPVAIVRGKGNRIEALKARKDLWCLIAVPRGDGISTREAFARFEHMRDVGKVDHHLSLSNSQLTESYASGCGTWPFFNDFTGVLDEQNRLWWERVNEKTEKTECLYTNLSGSGSAFVWISSISQELNQISQIIKHQDNNITLYMTKCLHTGQTDGTFWVMR
ncbi:MAG: 4-(cytidine 5'-diphospho)-2-C-methyl-D-erythritol kinase [Sphaerochaetaceae bacterium]|nr:4-(cytidine 5'-diphospho)-2-C-methyl-D-erythritol kinase [Sphaerochaetaceae bacterium]